MSRVKQAMSVPVVAMLLLGGCGNDDDAPAGDSADAEVADDAASGDDALETDAGVPVATDLTPDGDLVAGIMNAFLGHDMADILTSWPTFSRLTNASA